MQKDGYGEEYLYLFINKKFSQKLTIVVKNLIHGIIKLNYQSWS
ncbi:hypothetical protein BBG19_1389 [Francisella sp. MA067296]|nr:hypothetical protein BBG19_1389 [Francisella sp. MA067296]